MEDTQKTGKVRRAEGGLRTKGVFKKSKPGFPLVSIVTVVFNGERYLEETIRSVITQSGVNAEYIIIDGCSEDGTLDIIKKYEDSIDYWISEPDSGIYDGLAKGFGLVSGDIVAYINSDDYYLPNALSTVSDIFREHKDVEWVTGMSVNYNERGQITGCRMPFRYSASLIRKGLYGPLLPWIQQESTFWRAGLTKLLDFDLLRRYKFAGDFYMWYTFSKSADLSVVKGCLGGFRIHGGQMSQQVEEYYREYFGISERRNLFDVLRAYAQKFAWYFLPNRLKRILNPGIIHYEQGRWKKG